MHETQQQTHLAQLLACPICGGSLQGISQDAYWLCPSCHLAFPRQQGISLLHADSAVAAGALEDSEA